MCTAIEAWAAEVGKPKNVDDLLLPPEGLDERIRQLIGKQVGGRPGVVRGRGEAPQSRGVPRRATVMQRSTQERVGCFACASWGWLRGS